MAKRSPTPKAKQAGAKAVGRPTSYNTDNCDRVIKLGKSGLGRAEIAAALDIDRETLGNWEAAHPEFSSAMKRAHDAALAWWEFQGRKGIWAGKTFNAQAYALQMRNRFRDVYTAPDSTIEVNLSEAKSALLSRFDRLAATGAASGVRRVPQR